VLSFTLGLVGEFGLLFFFANNCLPSEIEFEITLEISLIDFIESSFPGITKSIPDGSESESTNPITGIFNILASLIAIFSF